MGERTRRARHDVAAIEARIRAALDALRPLLHIREARVELIEFRAAEGLALLRLDGGCPDCDLTAATMRQGIEAHLRLQVPEIRAVRDVRDEEAAGRGARGSPTSDE